MKGAQSVKICLEVNARASNPSGKECVMIFSRSSFGRHANVIAMLVGKEKCQSVKSRLMVYVIVYGVQSKAFNEKSRLGETGVIADYEYTDSQPLP